MSSPFSQGRCGGAILEDWTSYYSAILPLASRGIYTSKQQSASICAEWKPHYEGDKTHLISVTLRTSISWAHGRQDNVPPAAEGFLLPGSSVSFHSLWIERKSHLWMRELLLVHAGNPSSVPEVKYKVDLEYFIVSIVSS